MDVALRQKLISVDGMDQTMTVTRAQVNDRERQIDADLGRPNRKGLEQYAATGP